MIAHEVNNSVAGIVGIIQNSKFIIQDSSKNAKERLMDLSEFVTRFANVVKIPQPQLQLCDLSEEVDACRPFLESLCNTASVRLEFQLTDEAAPVRLDTILFQQVLINIVKNAIESIGSPLPAPPLGESPSSITISVKSTLPSQQKETLPSGSGEGASLTITDNGRGISAEAAQHLFTPFYSTKPQGQGIGLLLIRDILTSHGCTFSLLTDPTDHLTRFTINFPRL